MNFTQKPTQEFIIDNKNFTSRLLIGTALYPSLETMQNAIIAAESQIVTVSLKRQSHAPEVSNTFWDTLKQMPVTLLPNTAGCRNARDAITIAQMACEVFDTNWIKLEIIGDNYTLQPDPIELVHAAAELVKLGFHVLPYCTDDLIICQRLRDAGCQVIMPWAAPIGSGQGLLNPYNLSVLRERLPDTTLIIDAGIGKPSDATQVMEMGFDAVLLNSAVALSANPVSMATAFKHAIIAGREAYSAGIMPKRNMASPSTPLTDTPFWQQDAIKQES